MNGRYLLDTNIVIALFGSEPIIVDRIKNVEEIFIPSIVIGELYFGAQKSSRVVDNLTRIDEFVSSNTILSCDADTASHYGDVKNKLRQKGRPIPENDVWISALAIQYNLSLISRDVHFSEVEGLNIEKW